MEIAILCIPPSPQHNGFATETLRSCLVVEYKAASFVKLTDTYGPRESSSSFSSASSLAFSEACKATGTAPKADSKAGAA